MGRMILAVLAGAVVWAVLWNGGTLATQAVLPDIAVPGERLEHSGVLVGYVVWSVVLSVLAGWTTARVARERAMKAVWILAFIQLAIGIAVEISFWDTLPVWYHLVFLALLVPATVWGGSLGARRMVGSARAG